MKMLFSRILGSLAVILVLGGLIGCSGADQAPKNRPIKDYEEHFDPAKYRDKEVAAPVKHDPEENALPETETAEEFITIERVEQTMGFRVQVFSTTSIDDAEMRQDDYREILGDTVAVNIVFDAPYYKVRVGNYLLKTDAESACAILKENGLSEAWVVRDRVNHIITEKVIKRN